MKTKVFSIAVVFFFSVISVIAGNTNNVYSNKTENTKEYITFASDMAPLTKTAYVNDNNSVRKEKINYVWDTKTGWIISSKTKYEYNNNGQTITVIFTQWDDRVNTWSNKSQVVNYYYNENNEFLAIYSSEMDSLFTKK